MLLADLPIPPDTAPLPAAVRKLLRVAAVRIDRFRMQPYALAFVPSDYEGAYRVLRAIAEAGLARGTRFCEWGSGFGVVACLAASLGFESYGIEIDGPLVDQARRLAEDFGLDVEFAHGSFIPRDAEGRVASAGQYAWLTTEADDAYAELGLEPDDMDVVFAYPWPDEEAVTLDLFARTAGRGALLATYEQDGFKLRRKVPPKGKR
jgi:hypothetical protein